MKESLPQEVKRSLLYKHCMPEWLPVISENKEDITVKRGTPIFREADPVKGVFFIVAGKVKIHQRWGAGKELILRFANNGDMIGYRGLGKERIYPVTATALEDTQLLYISLSFFEATLRVNPALTYALMDFYANELEETEKRMRNMAHMDVRGRVAEALLLLKDQFGITDQGFIAVKLTKQDIASYVGTTYETISRVTSDFEKEQLIKTNGKNIGVLKDKRLTAIARPAK